MNLTHAWTSLVAQTGKNPPAMRETWVPSLGWEDPLEDGMADHSSIPAWRIPTDRGAWRATIPGVSESDTTERLSAAQSSHGRSACLRLLKALYILMNLAHPMHYY